MKQELFSSAWNVVPLPTDTMAWVVDNKYDVTGPLPAVAIGSEVELPVNRDGMDPDLRANAFEDCRISVLILFPDFGDSEPWVDKDNVFFSENAAVEAAGERKRLSHSVGDF